MNNPWLLKEFETRGIDGRIYLHYDNWERWRSERLANHPENDNMRLDIELAYPRDNIEDVPIDRNPHNLGGYCGRTCFYHCHDWSTIYGVHDAHLYDTEGESLRMLVESQNQHPIWGERISLFSTSYTLIDEPWGNNSANRFAFFRGQYWRVVMIQLLHDYSWIHTREGVRYPNIDGQRGSALPGQELQVHVPQIYFHWNETIMVGQLDEVDLLGFDLGDKASNMINSWKNYISTTS